MKKNIQSLDDNDTSILFKQGWILDRLVECEPNRELESYEEAMALASKCAAQIVGLRSRSTDDKSFWEIWRMPDPALARLRE